MVEDGAIEIACLRCGQKSVFKFDELEEDVLCGGCAQSLAVDPKQLHRAIAQKQKALNATIRGLKRKK
jgi:transcription elongation factor Elf1